MTRAEAEAAIDARIDEVLAKNSDLPELFYVTWSVGRVTLVWNNPTIEDTYLEFEEREWADLDLSEANFGAS